MLRLNLTLPTPAENVALDEALLEWAEDENPEWEFLRLWESPTPVVVVGRSSRTPLEVDEAACRERDIAILRRSSGGAAIVAGPGCLMYALVLSYKLRPELKDIRRAHTDILSRFSRPLQQSLAGVGVVSQAGNSDLAFVATGGPPVAHKSGESTPLRKFAGNSLRAKRSHFLYHGTLLYNFDLHLIETCLRLPPRQPDYRDKRAHTDFVMNLPITRPALVGAIDRAWPTQSELAEWPAARVARLIADRFGREKWNLEFP
jgi:lipoate-protein ligase A